MSSAAALRRSVCEAGSPDRAQRGASEDVAESVQVARDQLGDPHQRPQVRRQARLGPVRRGVPRLVGTQQGGRH